MLCAGVGRTDMTPPVGIAHAGWGAAIHERAEGVDMPFFCTALFLSDGATELAIVDLDICFVREELDRPIRDAIAEEASIPHDRIRLSATHTHAGNEFGSGWVVQGAELVEPYLRGLPAKAAEAVVEARRQLAFAEAP